MEHSKLISNFIAKLKIAYPYYFDKLSNDEFIGLVRIYQEELEKYDGKVLEIAYKNIIRNSKFMPSLKEIIDECEYSIDLNAKSVNNKIIEKMIEDGYFKNSNEIKKTYRFIKSGVIPNWLMEDMKKYKNKLLEYNKVELMEMN